MQEAENQLETLQSDPLETADPPESQETTEEQQESTEQVETQEETTQEPVDDSSADDVSRAREMGWRPKDEWRGDPSAWRPAKEFLRRGEEVLPIVRSRAQKAEAKVADLESRMAQRDKEFSDRIQRLDKVSRVALQHQAQQLGNYYSTRMRQAVETGDVEQWDKLNQEYATQIADLNRRSAEAEQAPEADPDEGKAKPADPETQKTVQQWVSRQDWWEQDRSMTNAAIHYHGYLLQTKPWMTVEDNLAETERFLEREFPEKLGTRKPNGAGQNQQQTKQRQPAHAPAVEGGGRQSGSAKAAVKSWNELPAEAKQAGENFIRNDGLFLPDGADPEKLSDADMQKARIAYAKAYWTD